MSKRTLKAGTFYCLPHASRRDARLTGTDHRVLGAICWFDRGGANGRGCFATQTKIAKEAACDVRAVKRSIAHLVERGHLLVARGGGKDGRRNVLSVVYDEPQMGDNSDTYSTAEKVTNVPPISPEIGGSSFDGLLQNQRDSEDKEILLNAEGNGSETALRPPASVPEANAVETAPFLRNGAFEAFQERISSGDNGGLGNVSGAYEKEPVRNGFAFLETAPTHPDDVLGATVLTMWDDAAFVAKLDREVRDGRLFRNDIAGALYVRLEDIHTTYGDYADPVGGRAYRLLEIDLRRDAS